MASYDRDGVLSGGFQDAIVATVVHYVERPRGGHVKDFYHRASVVRTELQHTKYKTTGIYMVRLDEHGRQREDVAFVDAYSRRFEDVFRPYTRSVGGEWILPGRDQKARMEIGNGHPCPSEATSQHARYVYCFRFLKI